MDMDGQEEIVKEFLLESHEGLGHMEQDLMQLEKNPGDQERIAVIFRVIHTLKGTGGFLGFSKLERLAHAGESLLSQLRSGKTVFGPPLASALLALVDALRRILHSVEKNQVEGDLDEKPLLERLQQLGSGEGGEVSTVPPSPPSEEENEGQVSQGLEDNTLRVGLDLLDQLMDLTGELLLARNHVLQLASLQNDHSWSAALQPLGHFTLKIQEGVMKTRLQSLSKVWDRFPRMVRDMAQACGKQIRLEMEGAETEIAKSMMEAIRDPLIHLLRNSIDHGIEKPEERVAVGKKPQGLLRLRAFHEAGSVHIEITDDGKGLSLEKIRKKALKEGLLSPEQALALGMDKAVRLIFLPGFSTAEKVTQFSGRGVGMDVVKADVEKIGGKVEVKSLEGRGTTFKLSIPLTLAIIPALVVTARSQRFVLPRACLRELIRLKGNPSGAGIEYLYETPMLRLRGKLLPLVFLGEALGLGAKEEPLPAVSHVAVLEVDSRPFGLVVEEVVDFQEVVVKPLPGHLKEIPLYSGTTLLGDGSVALILDAGGIAQISRVLLSVRPVSGTSPQEESDLPSPGNLDRVLLFLSTDDRRMALRLEQVVRLETFRRSAVERTGLLDVIQYDGKVLPLLDASGKPGISAEEKVQVVIYAHEEREIGLVVGRILDILEADLAGLGNPTGSKGSFVLGGRVTELLDIPGMIRAAGPLWRDMAWNRPLAGRTP